MSEKNVRNVYTVKVILSLCLQYQVKQKKTLHKTPGCITDVQDILFLHYFPQPRTSKIELQLQIRLNHTYKNKHKKN